MNKIITFFLIIIFLVTIFVFQSCNKNKEENVVKIGAILPLTGNQSFFGESERKGFEFALNKINTKNNYESILKTM